MNEAQRDVALFRYSLIREAADESLTIRQRGALVRELACVEHVGPKDRRIKVGRGTIDRWIRAYRGGGFDALAPEARTGEPLTEKRLLDLAAALKREVPRRTAAQVAQIIRTAEGAGPAERTVQRHFARLGLNTRPDGSAPQAYGRFEAAAPGDLWTGDALHGPTIAGRKCYLFCFIDDHSRALVGYRWDSPKTRCASKQPFVLRWPRVACPRRCIWTTDRPWCHGSSCGPVPASGCAWCILDRGARKAGGRSNGSSRPCAFSSSSRSKPACPPT
jgi:putative transposase